MNRKIAYLLGILAAVAVVVLASSAYRRLGDKHITVKKLHELSYFASLVDVYEHKNGKWPASVTELNAPYSIKHLSYIDPNIITRKNGVYIVDRKQHLNLYYIFLIPEWEVYESSDNESVLLEKLRLEDMSSTRKLSYENDRE